MLHSSIGSVHKSRFEISAWFMWHLQTRSKLAFLIASTVMKKKNRLEKTKWVMWVFSWFVDGGPSRMSCCMFLTMLPIEWEQSCSSANLFILIWCAKCCSTDKMLPSEMMSVVFVSPPPPVVDVCYQCFYAYFDVFVLFLSLQKSWASRCLLIRSCLFRDVNWSWLFSMRMTCIATHISMYGTDDKVLLLWVKGATASVN